MTGLIYKEWKQNQLFILAMMLCGAAPYLLICMYDMSYNEEHFLSDPKGLNSILTLGLIGAFLAAGALQMLVLRGDDRKLWSYWISASPDGYRGFLRIKYEMIFGMIVLFNTSLAEFDMLFCAVMADIKIEGIASLGNIAMPLIFVQIALRAVDIPFTIRFGSKKGSLIKLIGLLVFSILLLVVILTNAGGASVRIFEFGEKILKGEAAGFTVGILAVSSLVLYDLSYRISCRLYLKGAEQYDR